MIAGNGGRDGENGPDRRTQDRRPRRCESGLTDNEHRCTSENANEERADNASAALKRRQADADGHEKRYGIDCKREDQPAEQAEADGVENKSKGKHSGGSVCIEGTVAPSTTTAAQFWT
jgi:hypothetical protein